jgi:hypothetical protein
MIYSELRSMKKKKNQFKSKNTIRKKVRMSKIKMMMMMMRSKVKRRNLKI